MFVVCPDCGADQQEVGKYCENCGRLITPADAQGSGAAAPAGAAPWSAPPPTPAGVTPWNTPTTPPATSAGGARFAVVRNGQPNPAEGFTITHAGEYLVGRPNQEAGTGVDIDLRQWVQPLDLNGQKQFLVHRSQCFLGLAQDGTVTIRACAGAETDTLVKPAGGPSFVPLQQFATIRPVRVDSTYPLLPGDLIYMGDPTAIQYFQTGDPTAQGTYLVLELLQA